MELEEAKELVSRLISSDETPCSILEELIEERDFGWVFYYDSAEYIKSGNKDYQLGGNSPIIVNKDSGEHFITGTAYNIEHYINAYMSSGDPHAELTYFVEVFGWVEGANKVETTKYINKVSELGLKDSKNIVDRALNNEPTKFRVSSSEEAKKVAGDIQKFNFLCRQLWSNQC